MPKEYYYCAICDLPVDNFQEDKILKFMMCDDCAAYSAQPRRNRLPDERESITHRFDIAGCKGYLTAGMYEDGSLGEIFTRIAKEGSVLSGLLDGFATAVSIALQYGVPLEVFIDKFTNVRFEPDGVTRNPDIPIAKSIIDYIFQWLEIRFLPPKTKEETVPNDDVILYGSVKRKK